EHVVDARWLMAYAASLGETAPEYFDTTRPEGVVAHPLFPVCYEWPLALMLRATPLGREVSARSVHATHDLRLDRLPPDRDRLATTAVITAVEPRSPGAYVVTRFETVDADGRPVSTTEYGSLYRGVACEGATHADPRPTATTEGSAVTAEERGEEEWSGELPVAPRLAHV